MERRCRRTVRRADALRLVVQPLQWNPDWNKPDCSQSSCGPSGVPVAVTYTFELRYLSAHVVEAMSQVTSQEGPDHPVTWEEFPTLYVAHGQTGWICRSCSTLRGRASRSRSTPANDGFYVGESNSPAPG